MVDAAGTPWVPGLGNDGSPHQQTTRFNITRQTTNDSRATSMRPVLQYLPGLGNEGSPHAQPPTNPRLRLANTTRSSPKRFSLSALLCLLACPATLRHVPPQEAQIIHVSGLQDHALGHHYETSFRKRAFATSTRSLQRSQTNQYV